jgi:hypothetical protein
MTLFWLFAGMSPDGPSGWTLYALEQKQRTERMTAQRALLRKVQEDAAAATSLPKTMPTPRLPSVTVLAAEDPAAADSAATGDGRERENVTAAAADSAKARAMSGGAATSTAATSGAPALKSVLRDEREEGMRVMHLFSHCLLVPL